MTKKIPTYLLLAGALISTQTSASFDEASCPWGEEYCLLLGVPYLSEQNDSRDNLLRLISESKSFALPVQQLPKDISRSRDYYFAWHPQWNNYETTPDGIIDKSANATLPLAQQISALDLDPIPFNAIGQYNIELTNRFVSNNLDSISNFYGALLATEDLSEDQRQRLAKARLVIAQGVNSGTSAEVDALTHDFPADSTASLFHTYLSAATQFYLGNYALAGQLFTALKTSDQPWLNETATYMLMRTALNQSSEKSSGEYGEFDVDKIDKAAATEALAWAQTYLQLWPNGRYADSVNNMTRRIYWYLQDWQQLAKKYEVALQQVSDSKALISQTQEYDNKAGYEYKISPFPEAPLVTFITALRALRTNANDEPYLTQQALDSAKAVFENAGKLPLWNYLQHNLWLVQKNYAAVIKAIPPAKTLPAGDILAFSEQVLYGEALMAQENGSAARQHWQDLLKFSKDPEQQQYIQAKLAATLVYSNDIAAIFAADSMITNLRFRSHVLKTSASIDLLRQQVMHGPNSEERTIALHTLLIRDLTESRYADWLADKKLISHIMQPVIGQDFNDVNLSVFDWAGQSAENGYFCPKLENIVTTLSQKPADGRALNCLGEFFRTTDAHVDLWKDENGNDVLSATVGQKYPLGQPNRQGYYQQIITNPKTEVEDQSYALYRAVMCYSPSGHNDCGGKEVDKLKRKGWFTQLKTQYPGTIWAGKLKYYW